jgi:EmrB/QacA subfamily drug resistance transporter
MDASQAQIIDNPRRRRAVLGVVAVSLMMVVSAVSGLNVALPSLATETHATQTQLQWIVDAYTVVFAGLLLFAGAVGDRYGRRETLLVGLAIFGVAAAGALLTSDPTILIGVRAAMGVGAAFVMPTTLSIITTSFPADERGRAVGVWVGVAGGGAIIGLFAAGLLLEWFSWNSFFALNVVLAAVAFAGTLAIVPSSRDEHPPALDGVSAALSLVGISGLVFAIIEGPTSGWDDPAVLVALGAGAIALVLFVVRELRKTQPMLDPRLFLLRGFGTGTLSLTAQFFAAFGFFFIVMQYLQFVNGFSALGAAAAMLPLPFILLPTARMAPRLADRVGFRRIGALGLTLIATGFFIISTLGADLVYWQFAIGIAIFALGMGLAGTPATTAIVSSLPAAKQGVASAVNDTAREVGSAFGIAVLGSVLNAGYRDGMATAVAGLPPQLAEAATSSIAFVRYGPIEQLGERGAALVTAANQAFADGVSAAVVAAGAVLIGVAIVVLLFGPRGAEAEAPEADADALALQPQAAVPTAR